MCPIEFPQYGIAKLAQKKFKLAVPLKIQRCPKTSPAKDPPDAVWNSCDLPRAAIVMRVPGTESAGKTRMSHCGAAGFGGHSPEAIPRFVHQGNQLFGGDAGGRRRIYLAEIG